MMPVFYKFLLTLVIFSLAIPFFLKRPDGRPLFSLATIVQDLSALGSDLSNTEKESPQTTTLYRWQDTQGQWHFSNTPRETSQPFAITPNSTIRAPRQTPPVSDNENTVVTAQSGPQPNRQDEELPLPLSAKQAIKTLKDAENIQKLMDNRTQQLDEASRQAAR